MVPTVANAERSDRDLSVVTSSSRVQGHLYGRCHNHPHPSILRRQSQSVSSAPRTHSFRECCHNSFAAHWDRACLRCIPPPGRDRGACREGPKWERRANDVAPPVKCNRGPRSQWPGAVAASKRPRRRCEEIVKTLLMAVPWQGTYIKWEGCLETDFKIQISPYNDYSTICTY